MNPYVPVLLAILGAVIVGAAFWVLATILGPKDSAGGIQLFPKRSDDPIHNAPFECGNPSQKFRQRFTVKFYAVALLFVLFDVEAVFLYPWATIFKQLGVYGFVEMSLFVGVLALGLVYVWRKGALEWT